MCSHKKRMMIVLINSMEGILSQCMCISNHVVHFTYIAILSMIKLAEKEPKEWRCPPGLEWLRLALSRGVVVSWVGSGTVVRQRCRDEPEWQLLGQS